MRHTRFFRRRRPRGDDTQIAVHLHGIGIDDRAAELFGKLERQRRLAAGGRPGNQDGGWFLHGLEAARVPLVQSPRRRLRRGLLDQRSDRAGLMMGHAPRTIDAPEQVGGGQRRPADKFHAQHAGLVADDHHGFVARLDAFLVRIAQNFAVGFQNRLPADRAQAIPGECRTRCLPPRYGSSRRNRHARKRDNRPRWRPELQPRRSCSVTCRNCQPKSIGKMFQVCYALAARGWPCDKHRHPLATRRSSCRSLSHFVHFVPRPTAPRRSWRRPTTCSRAVRRANAPRASR